MDLLPDWIKPELRVIKKAPFSFAASVIIVVVLFALFIYQVFRANLDMKNDLIASYKDEVTRLKSPQGSVKEGSTGQEQNLNQATYT